MDNKRERKSGKSTDYNTQRTSVVSYPTPLPNLRRQSLPQRTFTSLEEKITLENAIRVLMRHQHRHARAMTLNLFGQHEYLLEYFYLEDGSYNFESLYKHVGWILDTIEQLIRTDFYRLDTMKAIRDKHVERGVGEAEMFALLDVMKDYWQTVLSGQTSITYQMALDNLFEQIMKYC